MAKQIMFTTAVFAIFVQLASSCCGPAQWEGYEGVFAGVQVNGTGGEGKGKSYTAYDGKCSTADLPPYPSPGKLNCVPSDAKLVLSTYYGAGDNKYEIDVYEFMVDGKKMELSVTKGSCVPVGEHQQLTNGFADVGFMGITEGIKDPSVFDIPPECNNARTVSPRMQYIKKD